MKTDARVRYTKHIIQEIFLDLLKQKSLSKITVKEICEKAEINRGTFYKHYADVYDLMEKLEDSALQEFEKLLVSTEQNGQIPMLVTLLTSLQKYSDLITALTANSSNTHFISRMMDCCSKYALSHLAMDDSDYLTDVKKQHLYSYLIGGTSSLIEHWLQSGFQAPPEEIAHAIQEINDAVLAVSLS